MKKKNLLNIIIIAILLALFNLQNTSAELQFNWVTSESSSTNDYVMDICTDANGNILIARSIFSENNFIARKQHC